MARDLTLKQMVDSKGRKELCESIDGYIGEVEKNLLDIDLDHINYANDKNYTWHDMLRMQRKVLLLVKEEPHILIDQIRANNAILQDEDDAHNTTDGQ